MIESVKECKDCKVSKTLSCFYRDGKHHKSVCKECVLKRLKTPEQKAKNTARMFRYYHKLSAERKDRKKQLSKVWRGNNKDQRADYYYQYMYGLTLKQVESIIESQNGTCAICPAVKSGTRVLAVDHNHTTGKVRGVLCYRCNSLMRLVDNPELLQNAIKYKEKHDG